MTKNEAIKRVNDTLGSALLNERNTHWASVVANAGDEGWWIHIPLLQFKKDIHILLCSETSLPD